MGFFLNRTGQENPLDHEKLKEEFGYKKNDRVGFVFDGDLRNPNIKAIKDGKPDKERKPKKVKRNGNI